MLVAWDATDYFDIPVAKLQHTESTTMGNIMIEFGPSEH